MGIEEELEIIDTEIDSAPAKSTKESFNVVADKVSEGWDYYGAYNSGYSEMEKLLKYLKSQYKTSIVYDKESRHYIVFVKNK